MPAASTPFAVDDLIKRYQQAGEHHPVLLSGLFILDLLVIHPFEDGNGRVARLLTGTLLSEYGYTVGRYVSLEQAIADSADTYYQVLLDSTHGRHEGTADPWPWLAYFTRLIASAYAVFADRAAADWRERRQRFIAAVRPGRATTARVQRCGQDDSTGSPLRSGRGRQQQQRFSAAAGRPRAAGAGRDRHPNARSVIDRACAARR